MTFTLLYKYAYLLMHFYLEQVLVCIYVCISCSNRFETYIALFFGGVFITSQRNSALFDTIDKIVSFFRRSTTFCLYNRVVVLLVQSSGRMRDRVCCSAVLSLFPMPLHLLCFLLCPVQFCYELGEAINQD